MRGRWATLESLSWRREEAKASKRDQIYLSEFKWTENHPVVKTINRFLIEGHQYFPKTLPLPPLGAAREEGATEKVESPVIPKTHCHTNKIKGAKDICTMISLNWPIRLPKISNLLIL